MIFNIDLCDYLALGLGQQYPRTYGGFGINPYAGAYGSIGSTDPYINGFGSEYGSRYGSYSGPNYNRYGYGGIGSGYGGIGGGYGGVGGGYGGVGGFQY